MKFSKLIFLLLILAVAVQAGPRSRRHHHHPARNYHSSYYPHYYNNHFSAFGYYRYSYRPVMVTTQSTTTYPTNLVTITAESVSEDIVVLNRMMSRGVISEKDYERAKKTLLNRIGMSMNPDAQVATTEELIGQIEALHQMYSKQIITEKEFKKQKNKLLAMI
ncbi:MAG: SHOCT domain-containing protein [Candidatus Marinimicrobia bacterium]|jgi:hypothetical protein|nr:SHOCT domain-containing protein [Candidatus Neomarinimicrobiota bacterium]MBT3576947.1 SHOCT domain-containing protein [Candidatus Neomarinimicrobiota bacterium]MBT3681400.1 SHOCT domain-containing protein [Candidatus Neomarinimicrobiota bacterium]MBT3951254.1 SHOCT domain-containing protein [Candidatus Neomarinimicrobiota bacterium]MBT4254398.1 SHOCT domain-containing protein [Candidatus Neomarinimicrobiota bacterium]